MTFAIFVPAMDNFRDSFIDFLREFASGSGSGRGAEEAEICWLETEEGFFFPEWKMEIRLVSLDPETGRTQNGRHVFPEGEENSFRQSSRGAGIGTDAGPEERDILYLYEDRWRANREVLEQRIGTRLHRFRSIFARKCLVADAGAFCRLQGASGTTSVKRYANEFHARIRDFFEKYHNYGAAKCRYKYALISDGNIVAAAAFSSPLPVSRQIAGEPETMFPFSGGGTVSFLSYEWVRYASLPGTRVVGGMGKILHAFLAERHAEHPGIPLEVMTYSDNEWSGGNAYSRLGFQPAGERAPVAYYVDKSTFRRYSRRQLDQRFPGTDLSGYIRIENKGSKKYLLQSFPDTGANL